MTIKCPNCGNKTTATYFVKKARYMPLKRRYCETCDKVFVAKVEMTEDVGGVGGVGDESKTPVPA